MLELFQAEWCPSSSRVRQRLTELGVDYLIRQVPVEREERTAMLEATGADTIPALVLGNRSAVVGQENILAYLGEHFVGSDAVRAHRAKAAELRRHRLEKECGCPPAASAEAQRPHRPEARADGTATQLRRGEGG